MTQLSFFPSEKPKPTGQILRDKGIRRAVQHSEDVHPSWHNKALAWLETYARNHREFSGEMVRQEARGLVPTPPSLRAWGSVLLTGARKGWIRQVGYIKVENPLAHRTPATLWRSQICQHP